jgi:type VI secretion system protein ImpF
MANSSGLTPLRLPLIERLINRDEPPTRLESVRRMKAAVRRDLEWLLNARRPAGEIPEGAVETQKSVYWYGLPDICSLSLSSQPDRTRLLRTIQTAISAFEPRLTGVKVVLAPIAAEGVPEFRFIIDGLLRIEPMPERVSFDTVLELSDGEYRVRGEAE